MIPKALFFDLDDTLSAFDSVCDDAWATCFTHFMHKYQPPFSLEALRETRARFNHAFWSDEANHKWGREHLTEARRIVVRGTLQALQFVDDVAAVDLADHYTQLQDDMLHLLPGVREALTELRGMGLRMAVVTNGSSSAQRGKIARFGIDDFFEQLFIDSEVGYSKPDPRIFEHALRAMNLRPDEVWMTGDNLTWDMLGAQRAGIFGVWNDYRRLGLPNDAPAVPDLIIHSVTELPAHLARLARSEGPRRF